MHKFLVCAYKSQDFAQSQKNVARSLDRETVTFRKSVLPLYPQTFPILIPPVQVPGQFQDESLTDPPQSFKDDLTQMTFL